MKLKMNLYKSICTVVALFFSMLLIACGTSNNETIELSLEQQQIKPFEISKNFYDAVKSGGNADKYAKQLAELSPEVLKNTLKTDAQKKAFWLNTYNTYVQYLLKDNPDLYKDRSAFFKEKRFVIVGEEVSLDILEHGLLRNSRIKASLGYVKDPFPSSFEKDFRVEEIDWRIHFALNCGAKSCPPVFYYTVNALDKELEDSSKKYLKKEVEYKKNEEEVHVPALMSWFRGDFGGKDGVIQILKNYQLIPTDKDPDVEFLDYNWELDLDNYRK
ncbi:uncharacterized protein DUF547 [Mesonia algae]|uniref:Uncharacterized protein DUF547 n=1 Tax=Mesonia algae TaxID=213248 RepID=A0A2W7IB82_9FLAO|nr:DUF547 domain-containing protein [Mesonia algae]PZW44166.1 uncharacterized protein DUF547 [Mesonia algae]